MAMPSTMVLVRVDVHLFVKNDTSWAQIAFIKASNTRSNSFFGQSVAMSGGETIVVGAVQESTYARGVFESGATSGGVIKGTSSSGQYGKGYLSGAVYVFSPEVVTFQESLSSALQTEQVVTGDYYHEAYVKVDF
jgi:FG-GAP repeat